MDENTQPVDDNVSTDDQEWEAAEQEYVEDQGIDFIKDEEPADEPQDEGDDEPTDTPDNEDAPTGDEPDTSEEPTDTQEDAQPEPDTLTKPEQPVDPREVVREMEADRKAMLSDVEEALYGNEPLELTDADGDPIKTIGDVMKLNNPKTGQPFTEEQAAVWLMQANSYMSEKRAERQQEVERVAEVQTTIRDQAESILKQYKPILEGNPQLRAKVWQQYRNTLKLDESGKVILDAPVDMAEFFETTLAPYAEAAEQKKLAEAERQSAEAKAKEAQAAAEKAKEEAEKKVKAVQTRNDREDILSTGKTDTRSQEEKEWDQAAKEYYAE